MLGGVLDAVTDAIFALDGDGDITYANPSARKLLGIGCTPAGWPEALTFLDPDTLKPPEQGEEPITRILAGRTLRRQLFALRWPGAGELRFLRVSSTPPDRRNATADTVVLIDDVTEQEAGRQRRERAERLEALGQLTGGIAHDFSNILTTILYAIRLSSSEDLPEPVRRYLDIAAKAVDRGAELSNRLLAFARKPVGPSKPQSLDRLLEETCGLARPAVPADIALHFPDPMPGVNLLCDGGQFVNALLNLILNSRDAILRSGKGGRIVVQAQPCAGVPAMQGRGESHRSDGMAKALAAPDDPGRWVAVCVADDGPGMEADVRRRSIDPFYSTKEGTTGAGLGLALVYGFVQNFDGELQIASEPGAGARVTMILPAAAGVPRTPPAESDPIPCGDGTVVLLVEDEGALRQIMEETLRSFGYAVLAAPSGEAALEIVARGAQVDLLLADIVLPGQVSGFALARELRGRQPDLPVIYMSGYSGYSAEDMGEAAGPILEKPCRPSALGAALKEARAPTP